MYLKLKALGNIKEETTTSVGNKYKRKAVRNFTSMFYFAQNRSSI